MKAIFTIIGQILTLIVTVLKGDQPRRSEVEDATNQLEEENKTLMENLEKIVKEKENEENH